MARDRSGTCRKNTSTLDISYPPGTWLAPGYAEWQPPAAPRDAVACLWASVVPDSADREALVLPDACSDLVWEQGAGGYVAGPDTVPAPTVAGAGTVIVGVRFRPPNPNFPLLR